MAYCKVCGTTDSMLFYKSISTHCKEHWKERVRKNRLANAEHYRAFDRYRASMPHRVKARELYAQTEAFRISHAKANAKWVGDHRIRRLAINAVNNAIRDGRLTKHCCFVCGSPNTEAHHPDYSSPLDVVWLCTKHHKQVHVMFREIMRSMTSYRNDIEAEVKP